MSGGKPTKSDGGRAVRPLSLYAKLIVAAATFVAVAVFSLTLVRSLWVDTSDSEVPVPAAALSTSTLPLEIDEPSHPAPPSRLVIPSLGIDAHIKGVGLTASGNMATAGNFTDVGWYKFGTVPGMRGSAVVDGHVDNGLSLDGVFKHLGDIKSGDDIYVITDMGDSLHFKVSSVVAYDYRSVPADLIFNDKTGIKLKLITCSGSWVSGDKTYDKRLVVTADLV
jgi:hypothetical protein